MITTIFDKISLLVKENTKLNTVTSIENYNIKCNNKTIYSFDYELTTEEESMLDFIYHADSLGFGEEIGILMQQKISLSAQKSFFTKLFIYEKLSESEKSSSIVYPEYIPKLNTGSYDEKPKSVEQLLETYGSSFLKTDQDFRNTMKAFQNIKMISDSNKSDDIVVKRKYR